MIIFCCHTPICRVGGGGWGHDNVMRPTVSAPPRGSSLLFLSCSRKKKLTKRKAADYASVSTPAMLPAIRHGTQTRCHTWQLRQVPHFTPSAPPPLHAPDANVGRPRRAAGNRGVPRRALSAPGVRPIPAPWLFLTFSFVQPKEKANKKKGCRLRIRCYSGGTAGTQTRCHTWQLRQVPHFTPSAPPPLHAPDANVGRP